MSNQISPQMSAKEIIERLRKKSIRQKTVEQRITKQRTAEQKAIEKRASKLACHTCEGAVTEIVNHSKDLINHTNILRDMYGTGRYQTMIKGLIYTRDDIESRLKIDECYIQKNWERYNLCCKEGKMPTNGRLC